MKECEICKTCFSDSVTVCPNDGQPIYRTISGEPVLDGKYTLEKRLGQGGMGVVYRARHSYLKTLHAIKIILPDLVGNDPSLVTRFRQEALASAAIRHQNIVNVTDFGVAQEEMPFLVMDFIQGESLQDLLAREKTLAPEVALEILQAICNGVGAAHRQGIVHRDLKPLNIMLQENRSYGEGVKVLDFGLAKIKSGELLGSFIQAQTTGLMGSPYYMSPEQWSDEEPDARADVYSLGVILHQMLTGDVPFKGSSIPAIMKKHLSDKPPCFADLNVNLPEEFEKVICHSLAKTREERTASVEDLANEMRAAVYATNPQIHQSFTPTFGSHNVPSRTADVYQPTASNEPKPSRGTVRVLSVPAEAEVFVNESSVGKTAANGWLIRENVPFGTYRMRVSREGFADFETDIEINQPSTQVVANLRDLYATNVVVPKVDSEQTVARSNKTPVELTETNYQTHATTGEVGRKSVANERVAVPQNFVGANEAEIPRKKSLALPLAAAGAIGLATLGGIGFGAYKMFGDNSGKTAVNANVSNTATTSVNKTPEPTDTPSNVAVNSEMIKIAGGTFQMGRNDGALEEQPAHAVTVKDFWMDRTEVTNAEYARFVAETKYPAPSHFQDGKPLSGQENRPVVFVSLEDARAFAKWRSKRDGAEYRVPSEMEWEFAARNGAEATLYPWGNSWQENRAIINGSAPRNVGSMADGNNKLGVADLIGNVWEWTDSPASLYEGNKAEVDRNILKGKFLIRGACYQTGEKNMDALTATFRRVGFEPTKKHETIGFRLVKN